MPDLPLHLPSGRISGYVARPPGDGPWPAVVVLSEVWGLNDDIRRIADRFADNGYLAVAPDLVEGGKLRCMAQAMMQLSRGEGALVTLAGEAVDWVSARPDCADARVGVAGFCMGGGYAFLLGLTGKVKAVAPFYGQPPAELDRLVSSCPVVASYGGRDRMMSRFAEPVRAVLDAAEVPHDVRVYPESGHSFMNDPVDHPLVTTMGRAFGMAGFNPVDSEDGWRRMLAFFAEHV